MWPSESSETEKVMVPYNSSMLHLRYRYPVIFRKQWLVEEEENDRVVKKFIHKKINFAINLLPSVFENEATETTLMDALANCDELEVFKNTGIQEIIDYKWNAFAAASHKRGFYFHVCYVVTFLAYL